MSRAVRSVGSLLAAVLSATLAGAQEPKAPPPPSTQEPPPPPAAEEGGFTTRDSSVGYIDNAIPASQIFLRYDAGYGFRSPNRAEFFYAQPQPRGPGLPRPERSVDFQEFTAVLEMAPQPRWSVFIEAPERLLNPEVNADASGFGDLRAGFKYMLWSGEAGVATFQLRAFAPTGDARRGLGTDHASLEPALLTFAPLTDRLSLLSELRYWVPLGGTDFAGDVIRYGAGLRYDLIRTHSLRLAPIAEFVGWTVLGGRESRVSGAGVAVVRDSEGVSAVNAKLGWRVDLGECFGVYAGYGRALTGERWYSDVVRVELRWLY